MQKLLIATTNPGKLTELKNLLSGLPLTLVSLKDAGIDLDIEETGKTYEENSQKKALFYAKLSKLPAIADDGGLEIAALNNEPGIHSRRWLGHIATDEELIEHMKKVSAALPDDNRHARFVASLSLALPSGKVWSEEGVVNGIIAKKSLLQVKKGFPYRAFFFLPEIGKYYQDEELTDAEQAEYNHRYWAVRKLIPLITKELRLKENSDKSDKGV